MYLDLMTEPQVWFKKWPVQAWESAIWNVLAIWFQSHSPITTKGYWSLLMSRMYALVFILTRVQTLLLLRYFTFTFSNLHTIIYRVWCSWCWFIHNLFTIQLYVWCWKALILCLFPISSLFSLVLSLALKRACAFAHVLMANVICTKSFPTETQLTRALICADILTAL